MNTAKTRARRLWTTGIGVIGSGAIAAAIAVALPTLGYFANLGSTLTA